MCCSNQLYVWPFYNLIISVLHYCSNEMINILMGFVNDITLQGQSFQQKREIVEENGMDYKSRPKI